MCSRAVSNPILISTRWKARNRSLQISKSASQSKSMTALAPARMYSPAAFAFVTSARGQSTTGARDSRTHKRTQSGGTRSERLPWTFPCCWRSSFSWQRAPVYRSVCKCYNASTAHGASPAKSLCWITLRCGRPCCRGIGTALGRKLRARDVVHGFITFVGTSCGAEANYFGASPTSEAARVRGSSERGQSFGALIIHAAGAARRVSLTRKRTCPFQAGRHQRLVKASIERFAGQLSKSIPHSAHPAIRSHSTRRGGPSRAPHRLFRQFGPCRHSTSIVRPQIATVSFVRDTPARSRGRGALAGLH